ncbi:MAG: DNA repair exonuclease [Myxococcales bacterium]
MGFCFVHAADLHLDSPLRGLARYEGAPVAEVRGATRRALENLVQLCLEENARFLLLAGDLYDGEWRDYSTGLFFGHQMARLRETGTRVIWIRGNHDAQSKLTRHLALGEHCIELGSRRPETQVLEDVQVAVHGQGFASAAVTEDLSANYPEPLRGMLNIGLLHTALSGRPGHAAYAPTDVRALVARGYDYWALGHVHKREVVHREPHVVFPGNLQARHVRETGPKGATLVRVENGSIASVEHRSLDLVRFALLELSAVEAQSVGDLAELAKRAFAEALVEAEGRLLAARVSVVGRSHAHAEMAADLERVRAQIQTAANDLSAGDVWVEDVRLHSQLPLDLVSLRKRDDAIGHLVSALERSMDDPETALLLSDDLAELSKALPAEVRAEALDLDLRDEQQARELLHSVGQLLLPRLVGSV